MRILIEQKFYAFARGTLTFGVFPINSLPAAALTKLFLERCQFTNKFLEVFAIGGGGLRIHRGRAFKEMKDSNERLW